MYLSYSTRHIDNFKRLLYTVLDAQCKGALYTLKFLLLDHSIEDVDRFGKLQIQDSSAVERYNVHFKSAYRSTLGSIRPVWKRL